MKGKKFHRIYIYFFIRIVSEKEASKFVHLNTDATRVCFHEKVLVNVIYKSLEEKSHGNVFRQLVGTLQCPPLLLRFVKGETRLEGGGAKTVE